MIFQIGYVSNSSKEDFVIKKVRNAVLWTYVISDLKGEEIVGMVSEKELQKKKGSIIPELQNRVTKPSYKTKLRIMTSQTGLLTLIYFFLIFRVCNSM